MPKGIQLQLLLGPLTFSPVAHDVVESVREVQITANSGQPSGFQIRFALAKGGTLDRMLVGRALDPPNRLLLVAHVDGRPTVLSDGVITRHDISKGGQAGQSTLSVTGVDVSQMMDQIDLSGVPLPMPPEAQVYTLLAPFSVYGVVPLVIPSPLLFVPNPIEEYPQVQGTPLAWISQLADEVGYSFSIEPGPMPGMNTAYWGPEHHFGPTQPALTVDSDAGSNVDALSFSFDGISKTVHVITLFPPEAKIPIPIPVPDISPLSPPLGSKIPIPLSWKRMNIDFRDQEKGDEATARLGAIRTISRGIARAAQSANIVTGSGSLDVLRYGSFLRCRRKVAVRGAGGAYDGEYVVRSVSTTLEPGKATQRFTLARNALVPLSERVTS